MAMSQLNQLLWIASRERLHSEGNKLLLPFLALYLQKAYVEINLYDYDDEFCSTSIYFLQ